MNPLTAQQKHYSCLQAASLCYSNLEAWYAFLNSFWEVAGYGLREAPAASRRPGRGGQATDDQEDDDHAQEGEAFSGTYLYTAREDCFSSIYSGVTHAGNFGGTSQVLEYGRTHIYNIIYIYIYIYLLDC